MSPPVRGRGLKPGRRAGRDHRIRVAPVRGRGLKQHRGANLDVAGQVAPRAGARIETANTKRPSRANTSPPVQLCYLRYPGLALPTQGEPPAPLLASRTAHPVLRCRARPDPEHRNRALRVAGVRWRVTWRDFHLGLLDRTECSPRPHSVAGSLQHPAGRASPSSCESSRRM